MDFSSRYANLNDRQQKAVDTINGPVMVIAGPGTGKTELLSMRVASILRKTDELPENILCLTFTESGAHAMRTRLSQIIGPDAYKVAIHTFHSFGSEVMNQYGQFFYQGAAFRPADELTIYGILKELFEALDPESPLATKMNGEYTHLRDMKQVISDLKRSGLTRDELIALLDANEKTIDAVEPLLQEAFGARIGKTTIEALRPIPPSLQSQENKRVPAFLSFADTLAASLAEAIEKADETTSTKPLTAWRLHWMKKGAQGTHVLKSRDRQKKLREATTLYWNYLLKMQDAGVYDFDDMILRVVQAIELFPELRYGLQEKYHYLMVDEFQDTNLAQLRIVLALASNEVDENEPNIMAVGDDDQAIYSFQGADVGNIHVFLKAFPTTKKIVLTDNYRSTPMVLAAARRVITLGANRLEKHLPELDKTLTPHKKEEGKVALNAFDSPGAERSWIAHSIKEALRQGTPGSEIVVLARRHGELEALLPHLHAQGVPIMYERRDSILDLPVIILIEKIGRVLDALYRGCVEDADSLLPELMAHPAFAFDPAELWRLSQTAHNERRPWIDTMEAFASFAPFRKWLLDLSQAAVHTPLEVMIDRIIGQSEEEETYRSPLYEYHFGSNRLEADPDAYIAHLEALRTLRTLLRDHQADTTPTLKLLLEFVQKHRQLGSIIPSVRQVGTGSDAVQLMTAHKSKGLEFATVYVVGAVDSTWGERVRTRTSSISYPENLPLAPSGDSLDERLRLFFVAMTRAKHTLHISYAMADEAGKPLLPASFLSGADWQVESTQQNTPPVSPLTTAKQAWHQTIISPITTDMRSILAPRLEHYKLSATHLNSFLDVTQDGPQGFLMRNLLRFPQAMSPDAAFGTAIHASLQRAHSHLSAHGTKKAVDDVLQDFETSLHAFHLHDNEKEALTKKGREELAAFLEAEYVNFKPSQKGELSFATQHVMVGEARLTGALDLVDFDDAYLRITDYKTGKPAPSWTGRTEYEKIKLHKYRQQLAFYELLIRNSRDYRRFHTKPHRIQFIKPADGEIISLEAAITTEEIERLTALVQAVFRRIVTLDLPDTSNYEPTLKGIIAFEESLLE